MRLEKKKRIYERLAFWTEMQLQAECMRAIKPSHATIFLSGYQTERLNLNHKLRMELLIEFCKERHDQAFGELYDLKDD